LKRRKEGNSSPVTEKGRKNASSPTANKRDFSAIHNEKREKGGGNKRRFEIPQLRMGRCKSFEKKKKSAAGFACEDGMKKPASGSQVESERREEHLIRFLFRRKKEKGFRVHHPKQKRACRERRRKTKSSSTRL